MLGGHAPDDPPILPSSNQIRSPARTLAKTSGSVHEMWAGASNAPSFVVGGIGARIGVSREHQRIAMFEGQPLLEARQRRRRSPSAYAIDAIVAAQVQFDTGRHVGGVSATRSRSRRRIFRSPSSLRAAPRASVNSTSSPSLNFASHSRGNRKHRVGRETCVIRGILRK